MQIITIINRIEKQGPTVLHSTGRYIQYPKINHNGKEYKKEHMYIFSYIYITESLY